MLEENIVILLQDIQSIFLLFYSFKLADVYEHYDQYRKNDNKNIIAAYPLKFLYQIILLISFKQVTL